MGGGDGGGHVEIAVFGEAPAEEDARGRRCGASPHGGGWRWHGWRWHGWRWHGWRWIGWRWIGWRWIGEAELRRRMLANAVIWSAEGVGEGAVFGVEGLVAGVVDGVIGLSEVKLRWRTLANAVGIWVCRRSRRSGSVPFRGVFAGDYGVGVGVDVGAEGLEVFVLDDAGVGHQGAGVVDHGVALVVGGVEDLCLEPQGAVFEVAVAVVEVLVDGAGVEDGVGYRFPVGAVCEEVGIEADFDASEEGRGEAVVSADGYALVEVVEVVVVEGHAHGQSLDYEGGELGAGAPPLLFGVAFDELLVDVAAYEAEGLLFEVAGLDGGVAENGGCHPVILAKRNFASRTLANAGGRWVG